MIFFFRQVKCILTEHQVVVIFEHCEFMCNILSFSIVEEMYITNSNIMCQCICNTRKQHALHKNAAACLAAQCLNCCGWPRHVKQLMLHFLQGQNRSSKRSMPFDYKYYLCLSQLCICPSFHIQSL